MALTQTDRQFLERALALAERGRGLTSPNPMVGAVVVMGGRIAGEGFHAEAGTDHAEVVALKAASAGVESAGRLHGATMYVSLEPCCHQGRTPPCTKALIDAGIARVVVGAIDPSPRVNGRGIAELREAGIAVELAEGDLAYRAKRQNDAFRKHVLEGLPFVTYKYAMTLDGRVGAESGHSRWISGEESRVRVHQLRARSDAVLVGSGALRSDDPRLTVRDAAFAGDPPTRVVVDSCLGLTREARIVRTADEAPVLALCAEGLPEARVSEVSSWGVEVVAVTAGEGGRPIPRAAARALAARNIQSVLLEGGPTIASSWWDAGLVDKVVVYVAPVVVGGADSPSPLPCAGAAHMDAARRLREVEVVRRGVDVEVSGYLREPS